MTRSKAVRKQAAVPRAPSPPQTPQTVVPAAAPPPPPPPPPPLSSSAGRRRRPAVLLALVVALLLATPAVVAGVLSAQQDTEYGAQVELIHQPGDNSSIEGVDREMATHQVLLQRRPLVQQVAADVGRSTDAFSDGLSVEIVDGSSVLRVQVVDTDADRARESLDVLVESYLDSAESLASTSDIGQVRALAPAAVLDEPVGPQPLRAAAAGLLLGLLLSAVLLALLRLRRGRDRAS